MKRISNFLKKITLTNRLINMSNFHYMSYKIGDSRELNFVIPIPKPPPVNSNGFVPMPFGSTKLKKFNEN